MGVRCERTATGIRTVRDGLVLWNLEIDTPECRPFFHPLNLPSGRAITDLRPADHVWHLGAWFSWKHVNGANYWEPTDPGIKGVEPSGATRVTKREIKVQGAGCVVVIDLEYAPRGKAAEMSERRTIEVSAPDERGGYVISIKHRFKALVDVKIDRTPPHGDVKNGRWGGGYAGFTMRLDPESAKAFAVRGAAGGHAPAECTGVETESLDFAVPGSGEGFRIVQVAAPPTARFYVWPDKRMINPSPVYTAPMVVKAGDGLALDYRIEVYGDVRA